MANQKKFIKDFNKFFVENLGDYFYNERRNYDYLDPQETEKDSREIVEKWNYYRDYPQIVKAIKSIYGIEIQAEMIYHTDSYYSFEAFSYIDCLKYSVSNYHSYDINEVICDMAKVIIDLEKRKDIELFE